MSRRNPKAGEGPCPTCARAVFFRRNASGKLTYSCEACDSSGYADQNGAADRKWSASMTSTEPEAATASRQPAPVPPKPAPRSRAQPFSLDALMGSAK